MSLSALIANISLRGCLTGTEAAQWGIDYDVQLGCLPYNTINTYRNYVHMQSSRPEYVFPNLRIEDTRLGCTKILLNSNSMHLRKLRILLSELTLS
jgi:hypothetical protein